MCNDRRNSRSKFGGAARRRYYAVWKKLTGGVDIRPPVPSVRGLNAQKPGYNTFDRTYNRLSYIVPISHEYDLSAITIRNLN